MRKPPRTFLLVVAALDENDVPYLVADPRAPSRRVGIERIDPPPKPEDLDHFAENFRPRAHVVDATDAVHLGHFKSEAAVGTLTILGQCQAKDAEEATRTLAAELEAWQAATSSLPADVRETIRELLELPAGTRAAATTTTAPAAHQAGEE